MRRTRREFVTAALAAGAGAMMAGGCRPPTASAPDEKTAAGSASSRPEGLKILVLGGTGFLGPHIVERARERGHGLTLFNRGKTNPGLFPDLEQIHGDRDGGLDGLKGRAWDAVVDTSGYVPRVVTMSAELLAPSVPQYVFISTISVYASFAKPGMDESGALEQVPDPASEDVRAHYGGLKALCEQAVERSFPGKTTVIRPGLIVGPGDPTDRFTYWPVRMARGGKVLAPGDGSDPTQIVDARDLAAFVVRVIEDRAIGTFNATGPASAMTMREMLEACRQACGPGAELAWIPWETLKKHDVAPWQDMPAWVPASEEPGFGLVDCRRAIAAGLGFRPVADTARDTLAWWNTLPAERRSKPKAGLDPSREATILAAV